MSILDRTILRRLALGVALATLLLAALVLLLQLLRVGHHLRGGELAPLVLAALPSIVGFTLPYGFAAAAVESYGHLRATNQLEAMRTAGASRLRLARPALLLLMMALGTSLALSRLSPAALERLSHQLVRRAAEVLLEPGRFVAIGEGRTFFARGRGKDNGELRGVFVARGRSVLLADEATVRLLDAAKANGRVRIVLRRAELLQPLPSRPAARPRLRRVRFDRLVFELDLGRAVAPHVGFVAQVLADPRRLASPPLALVALGLLAIAVALRSRSRLRAALALCALAGAYVAGDIALAAMTTSLWPLIALVGAVGLGGAVALALR